MTSEMLHDALSLLPSDLITATDQLRTQPRKTGIQWRRWLSLAACAVLVFSVSFVFVTKLLPGKGRSTEAAMELAADCAPQEPAAAMEESASITGSDKKRYSDLDTVSLTPTGTVPEAEEAASGSSANGASEDIPIEGCTSETREPEVALDLAPAQYILTPLYPGSSVNISGKPQTVLIQSRDALDGYYAEMNALYGLSGFYESCRGYDEAWFESHDLLVLRLSAERSEIQHEVTSFELLENCEPQTWHLRLSPITTPEDNTLDENIHWHILLEVDQGLMTGQDIVLVEVENTP